MTTSYPTGESSAFDFSEDSSQSTFDIRDHLDKLEPGKGKNAYTCPVCQGQRLTVNLKSKAYQCWSGGCSTKDIREAIRPLSKFLAEAKGERPAQQARKPKAKKKEYPPAPVPIGAKLLKLPAPGKPPRAERPKYFPKGVPSNAVQITYEYSSNQKAVRYEWPDTSNPKGRDKTYSQFHIDADGKKVWAKGKARWPAYRIDEVVKALAAIPDGVPVAVLAPEGEPNVDLARSYSIAALTMQGSNWSDAEIQIMLETLRATGKNVVLAKLRDHDDEGIRKGQKVWLVARHIQFPCIIIDPRKIYPDIPEKGDIREILEAIGPDEFLSRMNAEIALQAQKPEPLPTEESLPMKVLEDAAGSNPVKSKNKRLMNLLETRYGKRLKLNEMSQQVELDGEDCKLDGMYIRIADELDIDISKDAAADFTLALATKNAYSPVRRYLESLDTAEPIDLNELALRYLGTPDPLHATMLRKTLIAAVARTFKPGCKHDTLCIFQGDQGFLKSTFWEALTGQPWFTDNLSDANEKDEKLKLRRYWVLEYAEFETAYKRKEVEQLKAFLSSRIDSLRRPYGRSIEDFPRTSIFVGTTNRQEFLQDPTGERRYWVIPVKQKIPIHLLKTERDRIWGEGVRCYLAGESWWLSTEEDAQLAEANKSWQSPDTWESAIFAYLENRHECTIPDLLSKAINIDLANQGRREQMRVSDIIRRNGWKRAEKQKRIDGRVQWYWERTKVVTGSDGVVTEVVTPLNHCPKTITSEVSLPVTTFLANNQNEFSSCTHNVESQQEKSGGMFGQKGSDGSDSKPGTLAGQCVEGVTTSVTTPSLPLSLPTQKIPREFEKGDRVVIVEPRSLYEGEHGEVLDVRHGSSETDYLIRLDKTSHNLTEVTVQVPKGSNLLTFLMREKL
ncbi:VapE family protein [Microcoleus sp. MOSTC5]|uniref:VapE domain-containing protein n=1 Tax=Microcoleus sp. MOSTC5 TaxID=3055378 RepID=UPI002FD39129